MEISRRILWLLAAAAVFQAAWYYPQLPATVASHFDGEGRPNGWMSREGFFTLQAIVLGVQVAVFVAGMRLVRRLPDRWINLPHKDYWLAPERREASLAYLETWGLWMACAGFAFFLGIFQLTIEANLRRGHLPLGPTWVLMAGFIGYTLFALARLLLRFRRPDRSREAS
jgi:serine/threonine-protein kinase